MKRILLTGSGGFIGGHLKRRLSEEHEVLAPRSYELDLQDAEATERFIEEHGIELIIHGASCGVQRAENKGYDAVTAPNLAMFRHLSRCVNEKRRMIHLGSGAEYDKSAPIVRTREEDFGIRIPRDPYGYSKYLISTEIEKRENILNLRIFGVYGEGEHSSRVTSSIITDIIRHRPITLRQNVRFSFIYIDDLCRIVSHLAQHPPTEKALNIAHPASVEIAHIAQMANSLCEWKSDIIIEKEGMNNEYTCATERMERVLGAFRFTAMEDGLRRLFAHLRSA